MNASGEIRLTAEWPLVDEGEAARFSVEVESPGTAVLALDDSGMWWLYTWPREAAESCRGFEQKLGPDLDPAVLRSALDWAARRMEGVA